MSKKHKGTDEANGDTLSAEDVAALERNNFSYDPSTDDVYDDTTGRLESPVVVADVIMLDEDPPSGSNWGKSAPADGLDGLFSRTRTEPNTMGQRVDAVAPGEPPSAFLRPGEAVDSDGVIGTPGEWHAELPDVLPVPEPGPTGTDSSAVATAQQPFGTESDWQVGRGVSPPPDALSEARAAGAGIMGGLHATLTRAGLPKVHREAVSGQYAGTPGGADHVAGQEIASVDLSDPAQAAALRRPGPSQPNGRPDPAAVPAVHVLDQSAIKGGQL